MTRPTPFDPTALVALAIEQHPDDPALAAALSACVADLTPGQRTIRVAPGERAERTVTLVDPVDGLVHLDVLRDGRIGRIEFYERLRGDEPAGASTKRATRGPIERPVRTTLGWALVSLSALSLLGMPGQLARVRLADGHTTSTAIGGLAMALLMMALGLRWIRS